MGITQIPRVIPYSQAFVCLGVNPPQSPCPLKTETRCVKRSRYNLKNYLIERKWHFYFLPKIHLDLKLCNRYSLGRKGTLILKYHHWVRLKSAGNEGSQKEVFSLLCFRCFWIPTWIHVPWICRLIKGRKNDSPREIFLLSPPSCLPFKSGHRLYLIGIDLTFYVFGSFKSLCVVNRK